jgi:hypothetical protein
MKLLSIDYLEIFILNMEQILYLGHFTILENLENILTNGYLYTSYERKN